MGGRRRNVPTLEDYQSLVRAYKQLQVQVKGYTAKLHEQTQQLEIKDEAIRRQTEDIKKLDAELVWTKAALEQSNKELREQEDLAEEQSWQERYVRLQAEMENVRRRREQRSNTQVHEERTRILEDMLPLADHLELALQHAKDHEESDDENAREDAASDINEQGDSENPNDGEKNDGEKTIVQGVEQQFIENIQATLNAFLNTLQRYNITKIDVVGEPFDPNLHEAVGRVERDDIPSDRVAEVLQTGYMDGEKLLRPARVLVSGG